jgi:hypothetical protein
MSEHTRKVANMGQHKAKFKYTAAGKLQLDVVTNESFVIDAFLQFDYEGGYGLARVIALRLARKVPDIVILKLDVIPVSFLLRGHLEIHHLGEQLQHTLADEAFGYIQTILARKQATLDDFVPFAQELFQNDKYNIELSIRVRKVAAAYAAYYDQMWLRSESYRRLVQNGTLVEMIYEARAYQARLDNDPVAPFTTAE